MFANRLHKKSNGRLELSIFAFESRVRRIVNHNVGLDAVALLSAICLPGHRRPFPPLTQYPYRHGHPEGDGRKLTTEAEG
jgi:hypothetical protein